MTDSSQNAQDETAKEKVLVRSAVAADIPLVLEMIEPYVAQRKLLPRTLQELSGLVEHGFTAELAGKVVGFAAVVIYSNKLAEIQCLAVSEKCQGRGVGRRLVECCVKLTREKGVTELMAITSSDQLFQSCGFDYSLPNERRALFLHPNEPDPENQDQE